MLSLMNMFIFISLLSYIMIMISSLISKKTFIDREKASPFECGFDPKSSSRLPFSLQFFLIAIIFLIFDIEIVLLMPIITIMKLSNIYNLSYTTLLFILILLLGLFHEWNQGALEWSN
nr:NADH dehydrogenase subunit 3 [Manota sp. WQY001]